MGIRDKFQELLHNGHPPPIPYNSKPASQPSSPPYWQPDLSPSVPVSANFKHELGNWGWGNNEAQNYVDHPQNSFHTPDGALIVRALINHQDPTPDAKFTSARLSSHQTLGRPRGSLSARITAPVAAGIWPAFWLLPQDPFQWPTDGEVDIMEAWNGDKTNHTCLHWGHFNGEDWNKHRVIETPVPHLDTRDGVRYDFAWDEDEASGRGRLVWYIDGRVVMKAEKPAGTRPMRDSRILINVAVGGNVCQGVMPQNGSYELCVRELAMWDQPPGGWQRFDKDFQSGKEGKTM